MLLLMLVTLLTTLGSCRRTRWWLDEENARRLASSLDRGESMVVAAVGDSGSENGYRCRHQRFGCRSRVGATMVAWWPFVEGRR